MDQDTSPVILKKNDIIDPSLLDFFMGIALVSIISIVFLVGILSIVIDMILNKDSTKTIILEPQVSRNNKSEEYAEVLIDDAIDSFETMTPESFNFSNNSDD